MNTGIQNIHGLLRRVWRDQKGITGLETAIVLIAFVVVASVFAYAVITTGLFSSEQAQTSAQAGVEAAKSTMSPKGSMILAEAQSTGSPSAADSQTLTADVLTAFVTDGAVVGDTVNNTTDGSSGVIIAVTEVTILATLTGGTDNGWTIGDGYSITGVTLSLGTGLAIAPADPALVLTHASAGFVVEGVKVGDALRNITDGSKCTIDVVTATVITCALAGGTVNDFETTDTYEIDMDSVSTIKFKVTPSPGAEPFSLDSANTVVSFNDDNNNQNGTYLATLPVGGGADPFATANTVYWTHDWLVGSGPAIDTGDVVEFTVQVKNLTKPLEVNAAFSVEIVPQSGSALAVSRTTPLEMTLVMDLN